MSEQIEQPLDGLELDYAYDGGGQIIVSFADQRLGYRWLSGPSNFVTLVIDLARKRVHSSALLYYGSQNEVESFSEATINRASRPE